MKVWILSHGCRYEGGGVDAIYSKEKDGLKAAEAKMQESIARTAELSTPENACKTFFKKRPLDNGHHYWIEHYCWKWDNGEWAEADSDYMALTWYELQ